MSQAHLNYISNYLYETFIKEGLIIIIACFVIGNIVKHIMPKISNDWIVPIVSVCGVLLSLTMPMSGDTNKTLIATKGLIMGWASTGGYEFFKRLIYLNILKVPGFDLKEWMQRPNQSDKPNEKSV